MKTRLSIVLGLTALLLGTALVTKQAFMPAGTAVNGQATPIPTPQYTTDPALTQFLVTFYRDYNKNSLLSQAQSDARLTPAFRATLRKGEVGGVDPILCAQNSTTRDAVVDHIEETSTTAKVRVTLPFTATGDDPNNQVQMGINVVRYGSSWQIDDIVCIPSQAR